jgi:hypothetical protein
MIVYTALINQVTEFRKCWLYCRAEFAPGLLYTSTIFFFFFFGSTQGFILARQVLYHLSHSAALSCVFERLLAQIALAQWNYFVPPPNLTMLETGLTLGVWENSLERVTHSLA